MLNIMYAHLIVTCWGKVHMLITFIVNIDVTEYEGNMRFGLTTLIFLINLSALSMAHAAVVSYNFTADLSSVFRTPSSGSTAETAAGFSSISGTFSYDTSATNNGLFGFGLYDTGSIIINEFAIPAGGSATSATANNFFGFDTFDLTYTVPSDRFAVSLNFVDSSQTLLSSSDLPLFLFLTDPLATISFIDIRRRRSAFVNFDLTSISPVPLPGAISMMIGSLIGFAFIRRKYKC